MNAQAQGPMVHVEFVMIPVEDKNATRQEGRPIFNDVEHCRIRWVGDNKRELVEPAHQKFLFDKEQRRYVTYAEHYHQHYRAFKEGQDQQANSGTPLAEVPFLTQSKRAELRALNIHTLEQLAHLDGPALQRLGMGGRDLKNKAEAFMNAARDSALETRLSEENGALRDQIASLQAQMTELMRAAKPAPAPRMAPEPEGGPASHFANWQDEDIKAFIADRTGQRPRGNPSHATLVGMADDILAAEAKEAEAA